MFSISFRKYRDEEKEKQLVYFDHQNVNSLCSSTARASSVFLSSYRNTVLNQSACIFALGYFLMLFSSVMYSFNPSMQCSHRFVSMDMIQPRQSLKQLLERYTVKY